MAVNKLFFGIRIKAESIYLAEPWQLNISFSVFSVSLFTFITASILKFLDVQFLVQILSFFSPFSH